MNVWPLGETRWWYAAGGIYTSRSRGGGDCCLPCRPHCPPPRSPCCPPLHNLPAAKNFSDLKTQVFERSRPHLCLSFATTQSTSNSLTPSEAKSSSYLPHFKPCKTQSSGSQCEVFVPRAISQPVLPFPVPTYTALNVYAFLIVSLYTTFRKSLLCWFPD